MERGIFLTKLQNLSNELLGDITFADKDGRLICSVNLTKIEIGVAHNVSTRKIGLEAIFYCDEEILSRSYYSTTEHLITGSPKQSAEIIFKRFCDKLEYDIRNKK